MTEGYHYTACGLDYVYLQNGFEVRQTRHGEAVAIRDARGLHEAIALAIISGSYRLRGQEVRFLRAQLKLSQKGLAKAMFTTRAAVARWETRPNKPIPGTADSALRYFYTLKATGHEAARRLVDLLTELDELEHGLREKSFREAGGGWHELPPAA